MPAKKKVEAPPPKKRKKPPGPPDLGEAADPNAAGARVWNRRRTEFGLTTGKSVACASDACGGGSCGRLRVEVRWADGSRSWPCLSSVVLSGGSWGVRPDDPRTRTFAEDRPLGRAG